jgi:hypothetical protein
MFFNYKTLIQFSQINFLFYFHTQSHKKYQYNFLLFIKTCFSSHDKLLLKKHQEENAKKKKKKKT